VGDGGGEEGRRAPEEDEVKVVLTGASGFVGSHVLRHLLMHTDWEIVAPVTFRHKGLPERIEQSICTNPEWARRVSVIHWDMTTMPGFTVMHALHGADVIMNVASESHVDRSIKTPHEFVANNTLIVLNLVDVAKIVRPRLILQMSTDEVYGPAPVDYAHREWDVICPSNPYSASKAMQEAYLISAWRTYGLPVVITNTMNIIGEMQDPEKFVPMIIRNILEGRKITAHVGPDGRPGSRFYLHARNLADAWMFLTEYFLTVNPPAMYADGSTRPDRFNIVGEREVDNIEMVDMIAHTMGKDVWSVDKIDFHGSRPGHDLRYALDGTKIRNFGWYPPVALDASLKRTVEWTLQHPEWLQI
jgi:dTDP-glucose 4,6-dehydratase